jgi:Putative lumazine-binding
VKEAVVNADYTAVTAVLQTYFDGLYHSDTARLREAFHPQARYVSATEAETKDGELLHLSLEQYFPIVDARPAPADRGEARADRIVSIEFAGPVTAFARVECAIGPKFFTDLLTLVKVDGKWRIIAKVFHFDLREGN